jgi:hypothetical protein
LSQRHILLPVAGADMTKVDDSFNEDATAATEPIARSTSSHARRPFSRPTTEKFSE